MTFHEPYRHKNPADMTFTSLVKLFYNGANSGINWVFPINFEDFIRVAREPELTRRAREPEADKDSRPKE